MIEGRVWLFGDNVNTDLMLPGSMLYRTEAEQLRHLFAATRPGWVDSVTAGDVLVAGENFGTGSARPAARSLRNAGIACVVAESLNGLFFRSCVSYGLLALECRGAATLFAEGDRAEISLEEFTVRNAASGRQLPASPIPQTLLDIIAAGGIYPLLETRGLVGRLPPTGQSEHDSIQGKD
jgi:3-isopropylmalate/(R)-2-methylmalate dehydratase small subunit